jgi:GNAT superfamily N-acetyltransferase
MTRLSIEPATIDHFEGISSLFERSGCPCFCQYFQFEGDHRAWQDQCANRSEESALGLKQALAESKISALVALSPSGVVGWCRFGEADGMSKLYQGRLYRGLPCFSGDRQGVYTVSCFLVDPLHRRQSVARRLLQQTVAAVQRLGARSLEALPRGATDVPDEQQWLGPLALYREEGFVTVHDFAPYPVMRREFLP